MLYQAREQEQRTKDNELSELVMEQLEKARIFNPAFFP